MIVWWKMKAGAHAALHQHPHEQMGMLLEGELTFTIGGQTRTLKAGEMFTTAVNNQEAMRIKILQGEREMARDNWPLGEFELEFEAAPKGVARVGVQFEIDANGILHVLARDTKTGREKIVEINSSVDVSDEAVEAMISESKARERTHGDRDVDVDARSRG